MKELNKEERNMISGGVSEIEMWKEEGWHQTDYIDENICRNCGSKDTYYMEKFSKGKNNAWLFYCNKCKMPYRVPIAKS